MRPARRGLSRLLLVALGLLVLVPGVGAASCKLLVRDSHRRLAVGTVSPIQVRIGPEGNVYYLSISGALHRLRAVSR